MSHHLIDISAPSCTITCKQGQLICRQDDAPDRTMPMEDIGAMIINSFSAVVHNRVVLEAARYGTVVVFCESFRPVAVLLPANRSTETLLTRAQLGLTEGMRRTLWQKTVTAKCLNQAVFVRTLEPSHEQAKRLLEVAAGGSPAKEATCARIYWGILSEHIHCAGFRRRREEPGLNQLLNYGYTVLLARVLQKMFGVGVDPTFGIGHAIRERATPLAYDLMEPFRIAVDSRVVAWVRKGRATSTKDELPPLTVSADYKKWVQGFLDEQVEYEKKRVKTELVIEHVIRSFREALLAKRPTLYRPWILGNTRWDGCS